MTSPKKKSTLSVVVLLSCVEWSVPIVALYMVSDGGSLLGWLIAFIVAKLLTNHTRASLIEASAR